MGLKGISKHLRPEFPIIFFIYILSSFKLFNEKLSTNSALIPFHSVNFHFSLLYCKQLQAELRKNNLGNNVNVNFVCKWI